MNTSSITASSPYDFSKMMQDPGFANFAYEIINYAKANKWEMVSPQQRAAELWNSPENMQKGIAERMDIINKYYQEQTDQEAKQAQAAKDYQSSDYYNTIEALNQGLEKDTSDLADTEGQSGTWASSARQERMNSLAGQYANKYSDAYNRAVYSAEKSGVENQKTLGYNPYNPTFNKFNVQQGVKPVAAPGEVYRYNPFQQRFGSLAANRAYYNTQI